MSPAVLLDTCAVIWLANGDSLREEALAAIMHAALAEGVFVSPVSAWEIGMLARPRGERAPVRFLPDPATWFARFMAGPAIKTAALTGEIAIAASTLPEPLHGDPADRLLLATARHLAMPLVTRDSRILAWAAAGHVAAIEC
ncbi:MAG TPA: type II toxin-antitoxin system VapC family toxin [Caulobacteraceae bacterium]|jgi:PIN domain nuclease of toxin-antitoxin system|nr:type II toxin-antitoxin system VapC family toxin [Caulobacteraceae bacterium]